VHNECDENVDVAFDGVGERPIAGRDDDFKQVGPDRQMSGNSENINHRRHPYVPGAATKKTAEQTSDKRDQ
jgi:hypothetical protein